MPSTIIPIEAVSGAYHLTFTIRNWYYLFDSCSRRNFASTTFFTGTKQKEQVTNLLPPEEEIGTGGAGFRFMYTAFLQEAAVITGLAAVTEAAEMMSETGDKWREFAVMGAKVCKGVLTGREVYAELLTLVADCAEREERVFGVLKGAV